MSSRNYEAIAFLQDDTDFDLGQAAKSLAGTFPEGHVTRGGKTIMLSVRGWEANLHLAEKLHVADESREMAEHFSACRRAADIGRCRRRVEVWSTDPDPGMDHFNDFVFVLDVLEEFRGVILFDPRAGELI